MVKIFALNIQESIKRSNLIELTNLISKERAKKILSYRNIGDSYLSLTAELVTRFAVSKETNCQNEKINILRRGKPLLKYPPNIHFNISHSKDWIICAIAKYPIGVDIEFINKDRNYLQIAERCFTEEEKAYMLSSDSWNNKLERFYQLWSLKESYIKADGRGLAVSMNSFSIRPYEEHILLRTANPLKNCIFRYYDMIPNYSAAVCSTKDTIINHIKVLNINHVQNYLKNH